MDRKEFVEKAYRTGAVITAAGAAYLGGVSLKSAEAHPMTTDIASVPNQNDSSSLESQSHERFPKGVHIINSGPEIQAESIQAYIKLRHRWNGVLVLHAPKEEADVGFAHSPSSYDAFNPNTGFITRADRHSERVVQPGIEVFKGRTYAAVYDQESGWGWLDVKWAEQSGALSLYEFTDSKPRALAYRPGRAAEQSLPTIDKLDRVLPDKEMKLAIDMNGKMRHIRPSNIVPHA